MDKKTKISAEVMKLESMIAEYNNSTSPKNFVNTDDESLRLIAELISEYEKFKEIFGLSTPNKMLSEMKEHLINSNHLAKNKSKVQKVTFFIKGDENVSVYDSYRIDELINKYCNLPYYNQETDILANRVSKLNLPQGRPESLDATFIKKHYSLIEEVRTKCNANNTFLAVYIFNDDYDDYVEASKQNPNLKILETQERWVDQFNKKLKQARSHHYGGK